MGEGFAALGAVPVMAIGVAFFAALYFGFGGAVWLLTRRVLPALGVGHPLDPCPLPPGQLRRELLASCGSVLVFGLGLVVPWALLRLGWARFAAEPSPPRVLAEIVALFLWNELHFYLHHRLLHTRPLRRFHALHHRSRTPTPFSTYAFHPVEALMLGSVPLLPMLLHDFSFAALASLPVLSIALNALGHSNYTLAAPPRRGWPAAADRHQLHHARYHGNYGFLLPGLDRRLGTAAAEAADDAGGTRAP